MYFSNWSFHADRFYGSILHYWCGRLIYSYVYRGENEIVYFLLMSKTVKHYTFCLTDKEPKNINRKHTRSVHKHGHWGTVNDAYGRKNDNFFFFLFGCLLKIVFSMYIYFVCVPVCACVCLFVCMAVLYTIHCVYTKKKW